MSIDNIRLAKSALTDEIYAGYVKATKRGGLPTWSKKKNITNDFLKCVLDRWAGFEETITGGGKTYVISVREVLPEATETTESA